MRLYIYGRLHRIPAQENSLPSVFIMPV